MSTTRSSGRSCRRLRRRTSVSLARSTRRRRNSFVPVSASSTRRVWCRCCAARHRRPGADPRCGRATAVRGRPASSRERVRSTGGARAVCLEYRPDHRSRVGRGAARHEWCHRRCSFDGELLALFESPYWLQRLEMDQPELTLTKLMPKVPDARHIVHCARPIHLGLGDDVASDSGVVAVVGFIIAGFAAVVFAYVYRRRNG